MSGANIRKIVNRESEAEASEIRLQTNYDEIVALAKSGATIEEMADSIRLTYIS